MLTDSAANHLFVYEEGETFYRLSNADGKAWLLPIRNMRVALNLYQPSGRNGMLLKRFFPFLHRLPIVRKVIGARTEQVRLHDAIIELLHSLFNERELEFSVFFGTPCVHQKITMQISRHQHILGYLKLSDSKEIEALFRHESDVLKQLHHHGVNGIPQCLYCGTLSDVDSIFVQNTVKSFHSKVVHRWTPMHDEFVDALCRKTRQTILFEKSDYYQTLVTLQQHLDWLPEYMDTATVAASIEGVIAEWLGKEVDFSAYHGDFTPWNMFVEKDKLFVFDWEYARLSYPPMLDRYHFFTQTLIFERRCDAKQIIALLHTDECTWVNRDGYKLYLLDVISRFTIREKGNAETMTDSMAVWGDLLSYLCA